MNLAIVLTILHLDEAPPERPLCSFFHSWFKMQQPSKCKPDLVIPLFKPISLQEAEGHAWLRRLS